MDTAFEEGIRLELPQRSQPLRLHRARQAAWGVAFQHANTRVQHHSSLAALESLASTPHAAREFYVALALLNYRLTRAWPYPILEHIHGPAQWLGFLLAVTAFVCVCVTILFFVAP